MTDASPSLRRFRLEAALDRVLRTMNLRKPQREPLLALHEAVVSLDTDLMHLSQADITLKFQEWHPEWSFGGEYPDFSVALATGVGKTRLMGAMAAYLFLSRQSTTFLFIAPRTAIIRKLVEEARPGNAKYLFVDPDLVPDPTVWHAGNLNSFRIPTEEPPLFEEGPTLFIFSPQAFVGGERRVARPDEFSGVSLLDYVRELPDLVAFVDEAHHLPGSADGETRAWTDAVQSVEPVFQVGMTATPRPDDNVLYDYDLRQCLQDKLYTKDVRLIVRQRVEGDRITDEDWDHITIEAALDALARKAQAVARFREYHDFPPVNPVLLICAQDTAHADDIGKWLVDKHGLAADEVLVTHSEKSKTDEDIARLLSIEGESSSVRVVVNVFELTEGWDVTNVYVVAPLRRMGTFTSAVQTMGRGLRLPAGRRVDDRELDALDVLVFGRESLQQILDQALAAYGDPVQDEAPVDVLDIGDIEQDVGATKLIENRALRPVSLSIPSASRKSEEPDLDFEPRAVKDLADRLAYEVGLLTRDVRGVAAGRYDFDVVIRLAAARVISLLPYLSYPLHRSHVEGLVRRLLLASGRKSGEGIEWDWLAVAEIVRSAIDRPYRKKPITFEIGMSPATNLQLHDFIWRVPETLEGYLDRASFPDWDKSLRRLPIEGWTRCTHEAAAFESGGEYRVARALDSSAAIDWWCRNDPPRFRIPTPVGYYEPDFLAMQAGDGGGLVIEVKGASWWEPPDSDPRVKARAADAWCRALSTAGATPRWFHHVVLDVDTERVMSVEDLARYAVNRPAQAGS
jgi:hypothetical protein